MTIQDFIGVDPLAPRNPFAHDTEPETHYLKAGSKTYLLDLDHLSEPMRLTVSDDSEDSSVIGQAAGFAALLAYVAEWNANKRRLTIKDEKGTLVSRLELFNAYRNYCFERYRRDNRDDYEYYTAEGQKDEIQKLDGTFITKHTQDERKMIAETATLDALLYDGHMTAAAEKYLRWVQQQPGQNGAKQQVKKPSNTGDWLKKGFRDKLELCVKKGWLIKAGDGYKRAVKEEGGKVKPVVNDNTLAFILGVIFAGDRIINGEKRKGGGKFPTKQLEQMFGVKRLSDKRKKALDSSADYRKIYDTLKG